MIRTMKFRILSGYFIPALLLLINSGYTIYHLDFLKKSVNLVLTENYRSITAATRMIEWLERMDSALLSSFTRKTATQEEFQRYRDDFRKAQQDARNNITLVDEEDVLQKLDEDFETYLRHGRRFYALTDPSARFNLFTEDIEPVFTVLKENTYALLHINQAHMYDVEKESQQKARRAILAGIVTAILAVAVSLFIGWMIGHAMTRPVNQVAGALEQGRARFNADALPAETGCLEIDRLSAAAKDVLKG